MGAKSAPIDGEPHQDADGRASVKSPLSEGHGRAGAHRPIRLPHKPSLRSRSAGILFFMPNIAAYCRVSSKAQNLATQRSAIERCAGARGDAITSWYAEKLSGGQLARPELQRLRADVRAGQVRKLFLYRLDRLARSGIRDTFEVIEELHAHGCEVVTVADGFDLAGPAAEVVLAVMAWAAKMERLAINERISAARERLAAAGRPWGRPPRLGRSEREKARQMAAQGLSVREISARLRVPRSTIGRVLSRKDGPGALA